MSQVVLYPPLVAGQPAASAPAEDDYEPQPGEVLISDQDYLDALDYDPITEGRRPGVWDPDIQNLRQRNEAELKEEVKLERLKVLLNEAIGNLNATVPEGEGVYDQVNPQEMYRAVVTVFLWMADRIAAEYGITQSMIGADIQPDANARASARPTDLDMAILQVLGTFRDTRQRVIEATEDPQTTPEDVKNVEWPS